MDITPGGALTGSENEPFTEGHIPYRIGERYRQPNGRVRVIDNIEVNIISHIEGVGIRARYSIQEFAAKTAQ